MSYIRLIRDNSITSNAIRFMLHEQFSHIGFKMDDDRWLDCRLDGGVQIRAADSAIDTAHIDFTFPGLNEVIKAAMADIGTAYDVGNIFNFLDPKWPINKNQLICSRFVRKWTATKLQLINPSIPDWEVAPAHFLFCIGVVAGVVELDRWPKDLKL